MKKLIQICLSAALVFASFQAAVGGVVVASAQATATATNISPASEGIDTSSCLIRIGRLICILPSVGWNS